MKISLYIILFLTVIFVVTFAGKVHRVKSASQLASQDKELAKLLGDLGPSSRTVRRRKGSRTKTSSRRRNPTRARRPTIGGYDPVGSSMQLYGELYGELLKTYSSYVPRSYNPSSAVGIDLKSFDPVIRQGVDILRNTDFNGIIRQGGDLLSGILGARKR